MTAAQCLAATGQGPCTRKPGHQGYHRDGLGNESPRTVEFLARVEEYVFFTTVCGLGKHAAAAALHMNDRTLWRVLKYIREYPHLVPVPPELEEVS